MVMVFTVITKREVKMTKNNEKHWDKTKGLLIITLAIWAIFSMGIFLFGAQMNEVTGPFGYPLTYWFTCQGSLAIFVILIFWFAGRQEKIDEEFGFSEKGDD
jgi:putative solute:sodium symporter small subunit